MSNPTVLEAIKSSIANDIALTAESNEALKQATRITSANELGALDIMLALSEFELTVNDIKQYLTTFEEQKLEHGQATKDSIKTQKNQRKTILEFMSGFRVGADGRMYESKKAMDFLLEHKAEKAGVSAMAAAIRKELKGEEQEKPVDLDKIAKQFVDKMTANACTMTKAIELIKKQYNASK